MEIHYDNVHSDTKNQSNISEVFLEVSHLLKK